MRELARELERELARELERELEREDLRNQDVTDALLALTLLAADAWSSFAILSLSRSSRCLGIGESAPNSE